MRRRRDHALSDFKEHDDDTIYVKKSSLVLKTCQKCKNTNCHKKMLTHPIQHDSKKWIFFNTAKIRLTEPRKVYMLCFKQVNQIKRPCRSHYFFSTEATLMG